MLLSFITVDHVSSGIARPFRSESHRTFTKSRRVPPPVRPILAALPQAWDAKRCDEDGAEDAERWDGLA